MNIEKVRKDWKTCDNDHIVRSLAHPEEYLPEAYEIIKEEATARGISFEEKKVSLGDKICIGCGSVGDPVNKVPGNFFIEVILWLCFFVPGVIYTIWRLSSKKKVCRVCGGAMIPLDTPRGKILSAQ
jgi:hypothetical protein